MLPNGFDRRQSFGQHTHQVKLTDDTGDFFAMSIRRTTIPVAVAAICLAVGFADPVRADSAPATVLGQMPSLEDLAISPQGSRLAFVRTEGDQRIVTIRSFRDPKAAHGLRIGDQKLRHISWVDDNLLLLVLSQTTLPLGMEGSRDEWETAQIFDARTNRSLPIDLRVDRLETMNAVAGPPRVRIVNGRTMLLVKGYYVFANELKSAMFWFDPEKSRSSVLDKTEFSSAQWLVDDAGAVVARKEYNDSTHHWTIKVRSDNHMVAAASGESELEPPSLLGLSPHPGFAIVSVKDGEQFRWKNLSLVDGKIGEDFRDGDPLHELLFDRASQRIIGGRTQNEKQYVFFDSERQKSWDAIAAAYGDANVTLVSYTDDFRKLIVQVDSGALGHYDELFDLDARRGVKIGDVYDGVTEIAPAQYIEYPAGDGLQIQAVLTLPRGRDPKNLPLVVLPHGGPSDHVTTHFDWLREAIAREGYAVLEPNFRGSDLDWDFERKGFGEFGRKMQTDLSDGVRHLVSQGTVDPKRVCIVGASYGGYAALAGAALEPDLYRCAVSIAGIADLARMLRWEDSENGHRVRHYWDRYMGVTGPRDPVLKEISPIEHVAAISAPVLLIHGKDDTVVAFDQSEVMRDALRKAGKPVEFVTLKKEDHWLSRSETRSQMLRETLRFLTAHNPPE